MLERKLATEFGKGRAKIRKSLYDCGGPFHGLASKIKVAYCAGWIDDELFSDLKTLRDIRNSFAHQLEPCSPDAEEIRRQLENVKTPGRLYSDWGQIKAAEVENGVILYSGEKPEEGQQELRVPGLFALKMGIPAVVGILADSLGIELESSGDETSTSDEPKGQQKN